MFRILLLSFLLILIFALPVRAGEKILTPEPFNRYFPSYIKVDDRGNIWTAYYDLKGRIHVRNLSGDKDLIVNEGREVLSRGLAFDVQGDNAFVVWREKADSKKLYFRATHDGGKTLSEPVLLDDGSTEALTRIDIGSNSKGDVFVLWYGERNIGGARYHYYSVSSNDSGRTFSEVKNLTIGYGHSIYPTLLVDEDNAYIFSYSRKEGRYYMIFRKTTDGGKTWSDPVEIKKIGVVTFFIEPIKVGNRLHVFWFNSYDGVPVIEGAYSDDGGKTWKTTTLEDTRGLDVGVFKVAHDSKGHIYLTMSGKREEGQKSKVYIIRTEDNGTTWEKLAPLRHYPFENTMACSPDILTTDNGEVVVVWVDYRNIRSNLYMQFSKDYGRIWQDKDMPLEEPGRFNTTLYQYTDSLVKIKDRYYVLAYRFENDLTLEKANLLLLDFKLDNRGVR
jgi:hypothetical protein